jgi:hypothetical protein
MRRIRTQVHFLPCDRPAIRAFRSGISLHGHTEHSREGLGDLPQILERMPVVAQFVQRELERCQEAAGKALDFSRAYWRAPVSARGAHDLERDQIEQLGLEAIVSLTDHDNIDAGMSLQNGCRPGEIPVSVEWTIPYKSIYFHLGVHNMPASQAPAFMKDMADYASSRNAELLEHVLRQLDADPTVLVVFNHPLWDMARAGSTAMMKFARQFLQDHGQFVHALEINGLRPWNENMAVIRLGEETGHAVVSGGDRHGLEANANINLTRATTFAEFVDEIRTQRSSDIAILPQYGEPLFLRHLRAAWDIAREYPQQRRWTSRVFMLDHDGVERPLSQLCAKDVNSWIDPCVNVIGLLTSPPMRAAGRIAGLGVRAAV